MAEYTTLNEMFYNALRDHGNRRLFFSKNANKEFRGTSLADAFHMAENVAISLIDMGLQPGDRIGLMADNCLEWAVADIATLISGAVNTPRGTDSTAQEIEYILKHSESRYCFVADKATLDKVNSVIKKTSVEKVIVLDKGFKSGENAVSLQSLVDSGEKQREKMIPEQKRRADAVKPDDLFTIIYTSGTTGDPKGVMLTHRNMVYNIKTVPGMVTMKEGDRALSILPVWHIFERAIDYAIIAIGAEIYYTTVRDLREDFKKAQPTFMASAPRLWENLYQGIKSKVQNSEGLQKFMFQFSYELNKLWNENLSYLQGRELKTEKEDPVEKLTRTVWSLFTTINLALPAKALDAVVFGKIREALGGQLRGTISGGGALPAHVDEFFNVIGIPVYEGYGMTECAPIISVRTPKKLVQGSVGIAPDGTEVAVLNEEGKPVGIGIPGVIHVRGPQVMKGYYKNEEATQKALNDEGWLNTGDLGFMSLNGTLSVRGRVKDTIVLLGGENVEPIPIENMLVEDELISQVIITGQDQKSLTALIWPDFEKLREKGYKVSESENLNENTQIRSLFLGAVKKIITSQNGFKNFEKVTDLRFLPKPMEVGDELTNLFKMKRNVIYNKYDSLIKEMYS